MTISSFWRQMNLAGLKHNLTTLRNLGKSKRQAKQILDRFQPDLVVGTGAMPRFRWCGRRRGGGIPTAVHESNAEPGLTTKMLSKYVDKVMVGFEESRKHYPHPERVTVTGTRCGEIFSFRTRRKPGKAGAFR